MKATHRRMVERSVLLLALGGALTLAPAMAYAKTGTKIGLSAATKSPSYNVKAKLTAALKTSGGKALAGRSVAVQRWTGSEWTTVKRGKTSSKGKFTVSTMPVDHAKTIYRARYSGGSKYKSSVSADLVVKPKVYLSDSDGPDSWTVGSPFNVTGMLKPAHAVGTGAVTVNRYFGPSADGPWTKDATFTGYLSAAVDGSTYTASVVIPDASHPYWRFKSYHADDLHAATWSDEVIWKIQ